MGNTFKALLLMNQLSKYRNVKYSILETWFVKSAHKNKFHAENGPTRGQFIIHRFIQGNTFKALLLMNQ